MVSLAWLIIASWLTIGQVSCDCSGGPYSCSNTTISTTIDSGTYDCSAYKSCTRSTINITGSGDGTLRCQGAFSCKNSESLAAYSDGEVACFGSGACINVDYIYGAGDTYCDGILACANSVIGCNGNILYCRGEYSCMNSIISDVSLVMVTAVHAALNATIINPGEVRFYSYFSGYNTTVICESGYRCEIDCYGNSCYFTNSICDKNATCIVEYITNIFLINRSDRYNINNISEYINALNNKSKLSKGKWFSLVHAWSYNAL